MAIETAKEVDKLFGAIDEALRADGPRTIIVHSKTQKAKGENYLARKTRSRSGPPSAISFLIDGNREVGTTYRQ